MQLRCRDPGRQTFSWRKIRQKLVRHHTQMVFIFQRLRKKNSNPMKSWDAGKSGAGQGFYRTTCKHSHRVCEVWVRRAQAVKNAKNCTRSRPGFRGRVRTKAPRMLVSFGGDTV